jgi:hypothetical protein
MAGQYPEQIQAVLFPFTAGSKRAREDSLLDALQAHDAGALAIKPCGGGALFTGDACDARVARLALRHVLAQPGITAAVGGFASVPQLDNAAVDFAPLNGTEQAELDAAAAAMWGRVSWLRDWEYV